MTTRVAGPPRDRWFDGAGVRVHGLDWGGPDDGPPVLFLHGVGGNAWVWDYVKVLHDILDEVTGGSGYGGRSVLARILATRVPLR